MPFLGTTGSGSVKQYGGQANLGYFIKNSLRLRASVDGYLTRTFSAGDQQKFTLSLWVKRGLVDGMRRLFTCGSSGTSYVQFRFDGDNSFLISSENPSSVMSISTSQLFRDPAAWYHLVFAFDTTQATASNRVKMYVNGSQVTAFSTANYPAQNTNMLVNSNIAHYIGDLSYAVNNNPFDGYIAEVNFIGGQQLTSSSFGKTDAATNQWIPKKYVGTYGTNGFYLKFADASAATAAAIGKDSSGNGNNWTPNNISVTSGLTYDAMIDSPTRSGAASNYATLNPLTRPVGAGGAFTVGQGNLQTAMSYIGPDSTIAMSSGKWYWEVIPTGGTSAYNPRIGIVPSNHGTYTGTSVGDPAGTYGYDSTGQKGSGGTYTSYGLSYTDSDVIGVALDMDNGKIWFSKNGVWNASGDPAAGTNPAYTSITGEYFASIGTGGNGGGFTCHFNFGQRPFNSTPPSGFKSLNTFNLP